MKLLVILVILCSCDDNVTVENDASIPDAGTPDAAITKQFHVCSPDSICETDYCANLNYDFDAGPTVCTTECYYQSDCKDVHINSFCLSNYEPDHFWQTGDPGHCRLQCWPTEDREVCNKYDIFCPSDCVEQGLICGLVAIFPFMYSCRPEVIDP